jgi:flagellar protein FliO/FliZ
MKLLLTGLLVSVFPALAAASESQGRAPVPDLLGGAALAQTLLGLVLILALIVGGGWVLRRYAPLSGGRGAIQVVGALAVGGRERVLLVEVGATRLLLGVAPGRVQTLHVFAGERAPADADFATALASVQEGERRA